MSGYQRPEAGPGGLRLHLNENTRGCSPQVLARLRQLDATVASIYPDYTAAIDRSAAWLRVERDQILLTNGMDEGLFCATILALRGRTDGEGIVVDPAFEVYEACVKALAGRVRHAAFLPDFVLDSSRVLELVNDRTRIIFLNDPHNPSGARIPPETIASIAAAVPDALVFVDEAYVEFASGSFAVRAIGEFKNVLVGRTFAKAYGLAGLRIGALVGPSALIAALRDIVPPFSLNSFAAEALVASLDDHGYVDGYIEQSAQSRAMIYDYCRSKGIPAFSSHANFVLIRIGPNAPLVTAGLAARGIFIRDRSDQPGCEGCVRITAGFVEDTRQALAALEEVLCDARS
ncbi:MAG: pyridoxal phosphate-dependent aminotransferase [Acidobacteriota bacterium]